MAGLNKEVVLVGELKRFEIWDKVCWDEEFQRAKERFSKASQSLKDLGI
jgi:MraZ protein